MRTWNVGVGGLLVSGTLLAPAARGAVSDGSPIPAVEVKIKAADVKSVAKAALERAATVNGVQVVKAASAGLVCDGTTDNTAAFASLYSSYQASHAGFEIVLPSGICNFSSTINWSVNKPLTITGSGSNATVLSEPSTAKSFDGLIFTVTGGADLTLSNFAISKSAAMPAGAVFANEALKIGSSSGIDAGQIVISNMWIEGANESDTSHGWAVGLEAVDLARPVIDNLNVKNAGIGTTPSPAGAPTPTSPGATPAAIAAGVGSDIYIHGVRSTAIDTAISNTRTDGGVASIDIDSYQGLYVTNGDFVYSYYGIRSDSGVGTDESMNVESSLFNNVIAGFYLNQNSTVAIAGNLISFPGGQFTTAHWQGIWAYNSGEVAITGNNFFGGAAADAYGVAFTAPGKAGYPGFPDTISDNTFYTISNTCVYNDINFSAISGTGNSAQGCGQHFLNDLNGGNDYFSNNFQFPDVYTDGNRNTTIAKGLTIGSYANTGTLKINDSTGATVFSVDGSGNTTISGNDIVAGSQTVAGSGTIGLSSAIGVAQNSGDNAIYLYAAQGHSPAVTSGGTAATFYISPGGGAPSSGSTVNPTNLLLPTASVTLQRGVTRANINCNDLGNDSEDLLVLRDYNQYTAIGTSKQSVQNSTGTNNTEIFGLTFAITRDATSGSPTIVGTVNPPASGSTPALVCSGRIETQITY